MYIKKPLKFIIPIIVSYCCFSVYGKSMPSPESVYSITKKVADWQIETFEEQGTYRALPSHKKKWNHREKHHDLDWTNGALYSGMYEWSQISNDRKYADWLISIGSRNDWKLHKRPYHADDHTVGQFYLNLYEDFDSLKMYSPTKKHFDWILENPRTGTLVWTAKPTDAHHRWGWCDALFMAPPVWARLAKISGEQKYLDFMHEEYQETYDLLWDKEEHLFWRDSSFFKKREKNGRKIFWARGNGWVFGGLALMIPDLPKNWEERGFYIELFRQMAAKLKDIQRSDGTWSMGLLGGEEAYPIHETSGTSFYTFGLAWGINSGILDAEEYTPVVLKAWNKLTESVTDDGLLGYVQPIGAAPGDSYQNYSEVYGVGAFLAAGSQVYQLVGGSVPYVCSEKHETITFMEDAGWCWYQDPRAIISNGKLLIGGVSGQNGDVKLSVFDLKKEKDLGTVVLHEKFQRDDHDVPALYERKDGSILAVWAKHGNDKIHYYSITESDDFLTWGERREYHHQYQDKRGVTYMNLFNMEDEGLLYNFFRDGEFFNPCFITSSDDGLTWGNYQHLLADEVGGRQRPYARYLKRDSNTVGISFTDGHPRQYGNSLYYAELKNGSFYTVDGKKIKDLKNGPLLTSEADKLFKGSETKVKPKGCESVPMSSWTCAAAVDELSNPIIGYSLYLNNLDHRYRIVSWNGSKWSDREIAFAGKCLYRRESSYTGLMAIDPIDPDHVYISSDVNPSTGQDLNGTHEIYSATIGEKDNISTIEWVALTSGSAERNIRPIVVAGEGYKVLIWLNGPWNTFVDYASDVKGIILERP